MMWPRYGARLVRTIGTHDLVTATDSHHRQLAYTTARRTERSRLPAEPCPGPAEMDVESSDLAQRRMLTISEAASRLSVGRSTVYSMLARGVLSSVTIGRLRRIPIDSLEGFLSSLQVAPSGAIGPE